MKSDIVSRLFWLVAFLLPSIAGIVGIIREMNNVRLPQYNYLLIGLLVFLTIVMLFGSAMTFAHAFFTRLFRYLSFWSDRIRTPFIYNVIRIKLEYLNDDGSLVSFRRDNHISKLSYKKTKRMLRMPIEMDGAIIRDSVSGINVAHSFSSNSKVLFHCYFDEAETVDGEHFASYSFNVADAFVSKDEYWIFLVGHYCKCFYLELKLPSTIRIKDPKLFYKMIAKKDLTEDSDLDLKKNDVNGWDEVELPKVMIESYDQGHSMVTVLITAVKPSDSYKLVWSRYT